jgi:hypothetical protein
MTVIITVLQTSAPLRPLREVFSNFPLFVLVRVVRGKILPQSSNSRKGNTN